MPWMVDTKPTKQRIFYLPLQRFLWEVLLSPCGQKEKVLKTFPRNILNSTTEPMSSLKTEMHWAITGFNILMQT